jgi:hypothetical protein
MQKSLVWQFLKLILASMSLSAGLLFSILVFVPLTDDLGNPIEISFIGKLVQIAVGLTLIFLATYLSAPILFKKPK